MLRRAGRVPEAREAYERAIALAEDRDERLLLERRRNSLD
jgi:predicted RNA polymerase sigma factor